MLDRYAHFHKGSADDVVNESLEYIFRHDKDFQQYLTANPSEEVAPSVRVKKAPGSAKAAKSVGSSSGSASSPATATTKKALRALTL
jgi:hypothetical protein